MNKKIMKIKIIMKINLKNNSNKIINDKHKNNNNNNNINKDKKIKNKIIKIR